MTAGKVFRQISLRHIQLLENLDADMTMTCTSEISSRSFLISAYSEEFQKASMASSFGHSDMATDAPAPQLPSSSLTPGARKI